MTLMQFFTLLFILVLAIQGSAEEKPMNDLIAHVDRYITAQMEKHQIPGLALAVVQKGQIIKLKGYGLANIEFNIPVDAHTVFQLYSVSKIWSGIAVMKLVERGQLSLETPVTEILDDLPHSWEAITVKHLLTHTSGISEWIDNPKSATLSETAKHTMAASQAIALSAELPLKFEPGEKFSYHRSGYNLLGMIIETLTQKSYADFLDEQVFAPINMTSAKFGDSKHIIQKRNATAYNRQTGMLQNWAYHFGSPGYPGTGLNASATDITKFLIALDQGIILTRESLEAIWSPVILKNGIEKGYGLGWTIAKHKNRRVVGHEGGGAAWVAHFPEERLSVVLLCNLNGARTDDMVYDIASFYLQNVLPATGSVK